MNRLACDLCGRPVSTLDGYGRCVRCTRALRVVSPRQTRFAVADFSSRDRVVRLSGERRRAS